MTIQRRQIRDELLSFLHDFQKLSDELLDGITKHSLALDTARSALQSTVFQLKSAKWTSTNTVLPHLELEFKTQTHEMEKVLAELDDEKEKQCILNNQIVQAKYEDSNDYLNLN